MAETLTVRATCPCGSADREVVFTYAAPPKGETAFAFSAGDRYARDVLRCPRCGHFVAAHDFDLQAAYSGDYVSSTYGDAGMLATFERIIGLDPCRSDNAGRVRRVCDFAASWFGGSGPRSVLDAGSGLCVFLHGMKAEGWACTALDPDPRSSAHAERRVGVRAVCADFRTAGDLGAFDLVTLNKVAEHVTDPIAMVRRAAACLVPRGLVYVEVPDGEAAVAEGPGREEFFVDHLHIFSAASLALTLVAAGLSLRAMGRLREPSGKFTLWSFSSRVPS